MKWVSFIILALVTVVVQTTIAPRFELSGARPDLTLIVVMFVALHVRGVDAITACWLLGLMADLQSCGRPGLLALLYGLAGAGIYLARDAVFRRHALTHVALALFAGLFVHGGLGIYYLATGGAAAGLGTKVLWVALYTALWAPLIHALTLKLSPWLGIELPRYSHRGIARLSV